MDSGCITYLRVLYIRTLFMSDTFLDNFTKKDSELVYDKNFVQSVFKKVERIASASFYIVDKIEDNTPFKDSPIKSEIYDSTFETLNIGSDMLQCTISTVRRPIVHLTSELAHLSALLTIASTSDRVPMSHAMLIQHEIDALVDVLDNVRSRETDMKQRPVPRTSRRSQGGYVYQSDGAAQAPGVAGIEPMGQNPRVPVPDRKERIKDILREKGQIGIKDISDIITDVSEKSIQRDLNDLILSGAVVRLGERRWSTYKLS